MDYYIRRVSIEGLFEKGNDYRIDLSEGCNCIYGGNGTGKTTIINLIVNSLNIELDSLAQTGFERISILLAKSGMRRAEKFFTLTRERGIENRRGINKLTYQLDGEEKSKPFLVRQSEDSERIHEKYGEQVETLKQKLNAPLNLTHVPLLRMHDSELFGARDRDDYLYAQLRHRKISQTQIAEIMDPSVRVLNNLQRQFVSQANENRKILTNKLENLKSKLIEKVMMDGSAIKQVSNAFRKVSTAMKSQVQEVDVDVDAFIRKLRDVGIDVPEEKIKEHFGTWRNLNISVKRDYEALQSIKGDEKSNNKKKTEAFDRFNDSYFNFFSMTHIHDRFLSVVKDVEKMQEEKSLLSKAFVDYKKEVNLYLAGKKEFSLSEDGRFHVISGTRKIRLSDLSSGEKHILSILGKAALSSIEGAVFVADEPELSLHLDWQRMILPSIIKLSPKSQIIVATHSPSIYARGATEIDLEDLV
ncbi:AAA family ATPase [Paraglaciecola sp.]|uniref:AAA family ATPase n=1 Tax=Paraglaciecola sp. TaxID=1920173 RepID=UPI003EF86E94